MADPQANDEPLQDEPPADESEPDAAEQAGPEQPGQAAEQPVEAPDAERDDEPGEEEEGPVEPDHPDTVRALESLDTRLDRNQRGRIWRIFFYGRTNDQDLQHIHGLHDLKEVWLLGTRVTAKGAEELRQRLPGVTVYR